jgi:hypothetical protein
LLSHEKAAHRGGLFFLAGSTQIYRGRLIAPSRYSDSFLAAAEVYTPLN